MDGSIFPGWQCQRRTLRYRPYEVTIPLGWASEGDRAPQFKQRILLFLRCHLTVQHGSGQSRVMKRMFCFCFLFCVCVFLSFHNRWMLNTLRPRQNGGRFADDILDCVLLNENVWLSIKISLKLLPKGPINNIPALVPIMTWRRPGDKPLSEPLMVSLLTHICTTRPQWVKDMNCHFFLHCTIYSLPVHMYRWCMYSFLSFNPYFCLLYRHFAIGDHYAPKHNLLNIEC